MEMKLDYSDVAFRNDGKLKLLIIVGTRPEIIRLAAVINKCRKYFDCILAHTGQNYDYNLNGIFFRDLGLADPDVYMNAVGDDLGATVGNIINCSYKLMTAIQPDAMLILGDTNSCLSAIAAKRLHIPIFHMEAGNRCKDCLLYTSIPDIADEELDLPSRFRHFRLKLMAHVVLLFLVPRENPDFPDIRVQEAVQHRVSEGTGTAGDHQRFVGKNTHILFSLSLIHIFARLS